MGKLIRSVSRLGTLILCLTTGPAPPAPTLPANPLPALTKGMDSAANMR
jgi:hypothetical protein